jgi:hypothetical protein
MYQMMFRLTLTMLEVIVEKKCWRVAFGEEKIVELE